jgi:hypothetical protein
VSHTHQVVNTIDGFTWRVPVARGNLPARTRKGAKKPKREWQPAAAFADFWTAAPRCARFAAVHRRIETRVAFAPTRVSPIPLRDATRWSIRRRSAVAVAPDERMVNAEQDGAADVAPRRGKAKGN